MKAVAIRAAVTFLQVAVGILVSANIFQIDGLEAVSVLESAAAGGAGAALSVLYNYITDLGQKLESGQS